LPGGVWLPPVWKDLGLWSLFMGSSLQEN